MFTHSTLGCVAAYVLCFSFTLLPFSEAGFTFMSGDDSDDSGHCETASSCNFLIVNIFDYSLAASTVSSAVKDILAIGVHSGNALSAFNAWTTYGSWTYDIVLNDDITNVNLEDYRMIYLPSDSSMTGGGIQCSEVASLVDRTEDIAAYVNTLGGSLMALTQQSCAEAYSWLPVTIETAGTNLDAVDLTDNILAIVSTLEATSLDHCCYHGKFTGPDGYGGMNILATDPTDNDAPIIIGGLNIILTSEICNDGTDNDGDDLIDLADPDCLETNCIDGVDNNFNGQTDCDDTNCQKIWPDCFLVAEICDDSVDNDGDGLIDLDDPDCLETDCNDGVDNNGDGLIDCDDANCQANWPACIYAVNVATVIPQTICQGSLFLNEDTTFLNALSYAGSTHAEDTMINCDTAYDEDFSDLQFLEVVGYQAGSESYKMLQKFNFSSEEINILNSLYIKGVFLFQKGSGFGQGLSRVYAGTADWNAQNASCSDRETDFFDSYCLSRSNEAIATPLYGWAVLNITDIFICQMVQYQQLNLVWEQDSTQREGQAWHSSESHSFAPLLVVYYGTDEPTSQPSVSTLPTTQPTGEPSSQPTVTTCPSSTPSGGPTAVPTSPTGQPSAAPSGQPSSQPSGEPSSEPSSQPTGDPTASPST